MDIESFKRMLSKSSKDDLINIRKNILKENNQDYLELTENMLNSKHPGWNVKAKKAAGANHTEVMYMGEKKIFASEIKAYIWLVDKFVGYNPELFENIDWQTKFVAKGTRAYYFARSKELLFQDYKTPVTSGHFRQLKNGWFMKLNLSGYQKFEILAKFSALTESLKFGVDWDWHILGTPKVSLETILKG
jgi:hypothetical protein